VTDERELPPRSGTYQLGIFGSMMDPPHLGHLAVVDAAHEALGLDRVQIVPAGIPPHRRAPAVAARTRLGLAIRAFADIAHAVVSDTEVERGEHDEVGYMVDTIAEAVNMPEELGYDDLVVEPTLIVGADQVEHLPQWHDWLQITEMARIAVVMRPDQTSNEYLGEQVDLLAQTSARLEIVHMQEVPISSTMVRAAARQRDRAAVERFVPTAIVDDVLQLYA
jgi:nicotinate-nucleotide adenylyltransferase